MNTSSHNNIDEETTEIDDQFSTVLSTLSQFKTQITTLSMQLKGLEKTVKKEIKQNKRLITKKQTKGRENLLDLQRHLLFQRICVSF